MRRAPWMVATIGAALAVTAGSLQAAPKEQIVIEDPAGDANGLNDQGTGDGSNGDHVTPADASTVTDLLKVTVSNDAKNLYIVVQTENAPPATQGVGYRVRVNPDGAGGTYCLLFEAFYPGAGNDLTTNQGHLRDTCGGGEDVPIEVLGSSWIIPRSANEAFGKGATLTAPQAQAFIYLGTYPTGIPAPTTDTTKVGTDYKFVDKKKKG